MNKAFFFLHVLAKNCHYILPFYAIFYVFRRTLYTQLFHIKPFLYINI